MQLFTLKTILVIGVSLFAGCAANQQNTTKSPALPPLTKNGTRLPTELHVGDKTLSGVMFNHSGQVSLHMVDEQNQLCTGTVTNALVLQCKNGQKITFTLNQAARETLLTLDSDFTMTSAAGTPISMRWGNNLSRQLEPFTMKPPVTEGTPLLSAYKDAAGKWIFSEGVIIQSLISKFTIQIPGERSLVTCTGTTKLSGQSFAQCDTGTQMQFDVGKFGPTDLLGGIRCTDIGTGTGLGVYAWGWAATKPTVEAQIQECGL